MVLTSATQWPPSPGSSNVNLFEGQSLAVALSSQILSLTSCHTGKLIHRVDCSDYSKSPICCLGWGVILTERESLSQQIGKLKSKIDNEDVISRNPQTKALDHLADLPKDLAFLEIEAALPKLSPLSAGGIE